MKFDPRITWASSFLFTQDFKAQFIWSRVPETTTEASLKAHRSLICRKCFASEFEFEFLRLN